MTAFILSISAGRAAFRTCQHRDQYVKHYGTRGAWSVWFRTWFDKARGELFNPYTYPYGRRLSVAETRQFVRAWITFRVISHPAKQHYRLELTGADIVRILAILERDHECIPIIDGILTAEYWDSLAARTLQACDRFYIQGGNNGSN